MENIDVARLNAAIDSLRQAGLTVQYLGPLPLHAMPKFFGSIDLLVVPSRTTAHWKEQFGRVIVEAAACGAAVVGSDSGAIPEVIGDAHQLFAEGDLDALARCIERQRNQWQEDAPTYRLRSTDLARRYSDSAAAANFARQLESLMAERLRSAP